MSHTAPADGIDALQALLRPTRERITRDVRGAALRQWVGVLRRLALVVALIEFAGLAVSRVSGVTPPIAFHLILLAILVIGTLSSIVRTRRMADRLLPTWQGAAERLDLAANGHNRIATAYDLVDRECADGFSQAAIADGIAQLRRVNAQDVPPPTLPPVRSAPLLTFATLAGLAALLLTMVRPAVDRPLATENMNAIASIAGASTSGAQQATPDKPQNAQTTNRNARDNAAHESTAEATQDASPAAAQQPPAKPASTMLAQAAMARSDMRTPNASAAAAANAASLSESPASPPKKKKNDRPNGKSDATPKADDANAQASQSNLASGGASAGRIKSVEGSGVRHETPPIEDTEAMDEPGEIEESNGSGNQRGGIQPSLPDRTAAPSRELGITGPKGKRPGTGRGGPSPPKKSRGAASLLMGVPIPDFVRGKTGPGPVTISIENMQPQPGAAQPGAASDSRARSLPESTIEHVDVPWSDAAAVQRYLQRLRENATPGTGDTESTKPQEVPQPTGNDL